MLQSFLVCGGVRCGEKAGVPTEESSFLCVVPLSGLRGCIISEAIQSVVLHSVLKAILCLKAPKQLNHTMGSSARPLLTHLAESTGNWSDRGEHHYPHVCVSKTAQQGSGCDLSRTTRGPAAAGSSYAGGRLLNGAGLLSCSHFKPLLTFPLSYSHSRCRCCCSELRKYFISYLSGDN